MDSDLNDLSYLYQYGEYVSPEIEEMARYLNALPEERIQLMKSLSITILTAKS